MKLKDIVRESRETFKGDMSGVPVVGLEHLIPEEISFSEYEISSDKTFTKAFHKGQVLFGRRRAYQKKAAIAHVDGVCSGDIMVLEAIPGKMEPSLLPFIIQNDRFFDYAIQHSEGGLSPRVKWNAIANYEFSLPSIEEQKILADKLWAAYRVKESYRQLLATTDDMVKAQFNEMFGSKKENTILGNFVKVRTGKLDSNAADKDGQYPFFTCSSDTLSINTYAFDCEAVLLAGNGEFSVKYYEGKFNAYQRTYVIESIDKTKLCVPFLYAWMTKYASLLKQQAIGGVIKYIKMGNITDAQLYLPSMEEQQTYLKIYHQAEATKASLRQSIDAIDRVIRSLINQ